MTRSLFLLPLLLSTVAVAAPLQSHETMREAAAGFLASQTEGSAIRPKITVARPDPRLRLASCEVPLETFLPPGARASGNLVVGIRCSGTSPWTIYLGASVRTFQEVVVVARPVPRGAALQAADLRLEIRDTTRLHRGYIEKPAQAEGMVTRRPLAPGAVLVHAAMEEPRMVQRGQQVLMVARAGGLEVRSAGRALSDGIEGELIRIRNTTSSRIVEALVTGPGTAMVQF